MVYNIKSKDPKSESAYIKKQEKTQPTHVNIRHLQTVATELWKGF